MHWHTQTCMCILFVCMHLKCVHAHTIPHSLDFRNQRHFPHTFMFTHNSLIYLPYTCIQNTCMHACKNLHACIWTYIYVFGMLQSRSSLENLSLPENEPAHGWLRTFRYADALDIVLITFGGLFNFIAGFAMVATHLSSRIYMCVCYIHLYIHAHIDTSIHVCMHTSTYLRKWMQPIFMSLFSDFLGSFGGTSTKQRSVTWYIEMQFIIGVSFSGRFSFGLLLNPVSLSMLSHIQLLL